jgi:uncharacterized metal-binding protein
VFGRVSSLYNYIVCLEGCPVYITTLCVWKGVQFDNYIVFGRVSSLYNYIVCLEGCPVYITTLCVWKGVQFDNYIVCFEGCPV